MEIIGIKIMEDNSEKSTTTTSQDTKSQTSKDKFVKAGQSSLVSFKNHSVKKSLKMSHFPKTSNLIK